MGSGSVSLRRKGELPGGWFALVKNGPALEVSEAPDSRASRTQKMEFTQLAFAEVGTAELPSWE